jgi:Protein of unknown function (DUF402)
MWSEGDVIVHREVLNSGHCWSEFPVVVVRDDPGLLATYMREGTPFTFPPAPLVHPWQGRSGWEGHGSLSLQRPGDAYSVRVFWEGPDRRFACWYVNFQEPFRRVADGYETQDLELDLVVYPGGHVELKDDDLLDLRVEEGRFTEDQARATRAEAYRVIGELEAGHRWWDDSWADWHPA